MSQTTEKKFTYDVKYVPEYQQKAIAGANFKTKKAGRPSLFEIRVYKINTKDSGVVIGTYLLFGGVPKPNLHNALEKVGFKVRRRPASWRGKDGKEVLVSERDAECWAVYYNTETSVTQDQATLISNLLLATGKVVDSGKTFLLPSWEHIEKAWDGKEENEEEESDDLLDGVADLIS